MGTSIEFYEPRHNSELKLSREEAAPGAQAEWCDLHCKWLWGRFQKSVYPEANSLNGPDHLGQTVKNGGHRERGAGCTLTGHLGQNLHRWLRHTGGHKKVKSKRWKSLQRDGCEVNLKFADSRRSAHATLQYKRMLAVAIWSNKEPLASLGDAKVNSHNQKPQYM